MAGSYEKGMYSQLMEVMARGDAVESDYHAEKPAQRRRGTTVRKDRWFYTGKPATTRR